MAAVGALLLGAVVPFTLVVIFPTNTRLLDPALDPRGTEASQLLRQWGRLHAVRSALSTTVVSRLPDEYGPMTTRTEMQLGEHAAQHRLPRQGMGRARPRRPGALRVHHARRRPGWPELGDDSQEAGRVPGRLRGLRSGKGRAVHTGARRTPPDGPGHRPQPPQGREHGHQREGLSGRPARARKLRCVCVGIRGRCAERESPAQRRATCPREPQNQMRSAAISRSAASDSSGRRSATPSCRRSGSSTTTRSTVFGSATDGDAP